jgi:hypothetical protein
VQKVIKARDLDSIIKTLDESKTIIVEQVKEKGSSGPEPIWYRIKGQRYSWERRK